MSRTLTSVDDMARIIAQHLEEYSEAIASDVKNVTRKVANKAKRELQQTSPERTGEYAKNWTTSVRSENSNSVEIAVHNKIYQLPHLLEKGHAKRGGGRVDAIPHIKPVEEEASENLEKEIKKVL